MDAVSSGVSSSLIRHAVRRTPTSFGVVAQHESEDERDQADQCAEHDGRTHVCSFPFRLT